MMKDTKHGNRLVPDWFDTTPRLSLRYLPAFVLVALVYLLFAKVGLSLAFLHPSATPVWPPTGFAFAALLLFGYRAWPPILLGAFIANLTTAGTVATSVSIAIGNTLEGLLSVYLINRFAGGVEVFNHSRTIFRFVFLAALTSTVVSAAWGVTTLSAAGFANWDDYSSLWLTWWLGDAVGDLIFAPPLVLMAVVPRLHWTRQRALEALALVVSLCAVGLTVFGGLFEAPLFERASLQFLCVPILVWAAFRFGRFETAIATVILLVIAIWGTLHADGQSATATNESLLVTQVFMGVMAVMALTIATSVWERQEIEDELRAARDGLQGRMQMRTGELRQSEERFRAVAETAHDSIISADRNGDIIQWNRGAEKTFGYTAAEALGKPLTLIMPERFQRAHNLGIQRYLTTGESRVIGKTIELAGQRKDGSEFPLELSLATWKTAEGIFFTGIIRDITEHKNTEDTLKQQAANLARSNANLQEFAHAVSHDLQEPLRMVSSFAELLAAKYRGNVDAEADQFLRYVVDGAGRMSQLISDLLAYSLVSTQAKDVSATDCEVVLQDVLENLSLLTKERKAVITHDKLPTVFYDKPQMIQLLQNLVGNAIKFGNAHDSRVHISARREGPEWIFTVRDNGIGIRPEHHEKIFGIFQRLHDREQYPGSGVGLAICKNIVERHGGRIWIMSQIGEGSTFFFTAPAINTRDQSH